MPAKAASICLRSYIFRYVLIAMTMKSFKLFASVVPFFTTDRASSYKGFGSLTVVVCASDLRAVAGIANSFQTIIYAATHDVNTDIYINIIIQGLSYHH